MKWRKLLAAATLTTGAYFTAGNYFYNLAMKRGDKFFLNNNPNLPGGTSGTTAEDEARKATIKTWAAQAKQEETAITSFDGLQLKGTIFLQEEESHQWMILVHGYMTNRKFMHDFAYDFYQYGFNLLLVDCRGSGKSEGDYTSMGWLDRLDVKQWVEAVVARDPDSEIALFGISMGGATVMMTSGEELPVNVRCIVEDCGYTSVEDIFAFQLKAIFHLPKFPLLNAADTVCQIRGGFSVKEASAVAQLAKNTRPMLFIHGEEDGFVPFSMLEEVYEATDAPKEKLVVPGAPHALAFEIAHQTYVDTVMKFVIKHML